MSTNLAQFSAHLALRCCNLRVQNAPKSFNLAPKSSNLATKSANLVTKPEQRETESRLLHNENILEAESSREQQRTARNSREQQRAAERIQKKSKYNYNEANMKPNEAKIMQNATKCNKMQQNEPK